MDPCPNCGHDWTAHGAYIARQEKICEEMQPDGAHLRIVYETRLEERLEHKLRDLFLAYDVARGHQANYPREDTSSEEAAILAQMEVLAEVLDIPSEHMAFVRSIIAASSGSLEDDPLEKLYPQVQAWETGNGGLWSALWNELATTAS